MMRYSYCWFYLFVSPCALSLCSILFFHFPIPRAPEPPAGLTRTTLPSVRPAWTSLPTGLALCLWYILRWDLTQCSSKIRCQYYARNTEISRGYNPPETPLLCEQYKERARGWTCRESQMIAWLCNWRDKLDLVQGKRWTWRNLNNFGFLFVVLHTPFVSSFYPCF